MTGPAVESFGATLRRYRFAAGLSQEELAERAGLSVRGIGALEQGQRRAPHPTTLRLLAKALRLDKAGRAELYAAARPGQELSAPISHPLGGPPPSPPSPLIGRTAEIEAAHAMLSRPDVRLLTVTGPGGVGKTRLAIAVAETLAPARPDGTVFVDLSSVREPALFGPTLAHALGLHDGGASHPIDLVLAHIGNRAMLVVLDNFEQIAQAAPCVARLASGASRLKILVTSRVPLRLGTEHLLPIAPLPLPPLTTGVNGTDDSPAVALFLQRARAVRPSLRLDRANATAIAEIVRRLDGLPLAIELAASHVRLLTPQALLDRLSPRLEMLDTGRRDAPMRQQTMRSAIAWSHDLLPAADQTLFRRLAVFEGSIGLEAVMAITHGVGVAGADLERRLEALIDQSLLQPQGDVAGGPRLTMLETIREYAAERLAASGETAAVEAAHAAYFRDLAEVHERTGWVRHDPRLPDLFEADHFNLRAALAWWEAAGDAEAVQAMAGALRWFWATRGHLTEGRTWLERGLALGIPANPAVRGRALVALGQIVYFQGDAALARGHLMDGLALYRQAGEPLGQAFAQSALGALALARRDFDEANALLEGALALTSGGVDRELAASIAAATTSNLAQAAYVRGDLARASELADQALARYREIGFERGVINNLHLAANIMRDRGETVPALRRCQESLALARARDDRRHILVVLESIARIAGAADQADAAARLFAASAAMRERTGYRLWDPTEPQPVDGEMSHLRALMGEQAFSDAWAKGQKMSGEEAIAEAMAIDLLARDAAQTGG